MSILRRISTPAPAQAIKKIKSYKALLKIKAPDIFEKKRDKLKNFLSQIRVYILFNNSVKII